MDSYGKQSDTFSVWFVRAGQTGLLDNSVSSVPKTGQTKCYDTDPGNEIPCPGTGQDGEIQAGVAWPDPRFMDNGDKTVTDNLTGLMWTKNANPPSGYKTWQQALDYVKGMNAGTYTNYGYTDWRLPNRKELHSLTDFSQYKPALPSGHPFTNVSTDWYASLYWSSTTCAYDPVNAWLVIMYGAEVCPCPGLGVPGVGEKSQLNACVWPVRSGQDQPSECSTWTDVISKYNSYVSGQAVWNEVIACYTQYTSP
jgi:hypothetical protein